MKARRAFRTGTTWRATALAAVAAAAVMTGCSNGASSSQGTTPATAPGTSTGTATSPATTTPTTGTATSPPASSVPTNHATSPTGTPACATSGLQASLGQAQGAAGSTYQNINFTNATAKPCTLYGFPGVSLLGGTPVGQIGAAAVRSPGDTPKLVTLPSGGTAHALLRVTEAGNYPPATCKPVTASTLKVYPPNQTVALLLPYQATGCSSTAVTLLTIGVVQAGTGS